MKAAIATWQNRVAPVFDVTDEVTVVAVEEGCVTDRSYVILSGADPVARAASLAGLGVDILICGAISRPLLSLVSARNIEVVPFVTGELDSIISAWLEDRLTNGTYAMPGCRGTRCRRRLRGMYQMNQEVVMRGRGSGGGRGGGGGGRGGGGRGSGSGRGGGGKGRGGDQAAGNRPRPNGECVCPQCGHRLPHETGVPCAQRQCPECGTNMTRG